MKPKISISKWAALLAIIGGMAALPLNATALTVNTDQSGTPDNGSTYTNENIKVLASGVYIGNGITVTCDNAIAVEIIGGKATLNNSNITKTGDTGFGMFVYPSGTLIVNNSVFTGSSNANAYVRVQGADSLVVWTGGTINTTNHRGSGAFEILNAASGTLSDAVINVTGTGMGVYVSDAASLDVQRVTINTQDGGRGFHVSGTGTVLRATDVNVDIANGEGIAVVHGAYAELTGINLVTGGGADSPGIMMYGSGTLIVNDSNFTTNQGAAILTQNDASDGRMVIINGGTFDTNGLVDIKSSGSNEIIFNNADTSKAGGVTTTDTDNSTTTVTINGGSGIIGDVTNSGSGALTVNIDNSSLTGDITNGGDGSLTINLDNNSYGKGGWNGGNLSLEGGSTWDFSGTHSTLDNLDNNGTLTTDLNTDSGEGGKIVITATGSGTGTIHIDTTGNGTGNPDKLINDLVVNPGPDWKWDYMDWGLEELIKSGTNADGSNHFTQQGNSVAGAVLNSSAALQQTMWFAQQNSLLKRMGELRFNHDNPVTLSGKDDKAVTTLDADSLIENLWIRSYGQQLNVGGKVSGHSYEQMVYGMDLGTDHKFTLDNHNDLYLGVYAGYGRSDVDYRVAGAEATLDSYYGGIYATWLHDSGLYVDVTFKAAGVDNELKAPYGSNQLTANYNDLNLGGSIEIGKKFTFRDDWFIEPQLQVNYLHLLAEDYQAGPMSIAAQDLDAIQFRVGSLFGRTIKLANGGAIQPYVKISGVEAISSGGAIRNGYQSIRSNIDGARAELGGGLIWQIDVANQLHLDYEASFGDKYDKPWGLTAGFRHQF